MGQQKREQIEAEAQRRKERILTYMTQDPPVDLPTIAKMEGMHERALRFLIKSEIEPENGVDYLGKASKPSATNAVPYGLSTSTARFRQKLGDHLYLLRERGNDSSHFGRNQIAPRVGMNNRQQLKAEQRPFAHDWSLSQIERLARELGEDPREFMLKCLTT